MKRKLIIVIVTVAVITGIIVLIFGKKKNGSSSTIKTAVVAQKTFTKEVQSSGKTKAKKSADLKFQISGKLIWVGVKEGDHVNQYQAIAQLDSREVEKNLQKALTDYSSERNDFEETWRVTYNGTQDPNAALNDTVKRILQKNQWDLNKAVYDVELKSLAVELATLTSPISGIVTHIDTPIAGVNVTPATATFEVVDPESLVFEANIDETDVGILEVGQTASVALDAFNESTFSAKISYISYSSVLSGGGATVFPVEVAFETAQKLRIGLNGDVTINAVTIPDALLIPIDAIREDNTGKYVYVKIGTIYQKTPIKTRTSNNTDIIIEEGLSVGDEVVVKGFTQIPKK
jgi:membrane fusion protein (multidrug efflux system)